MSGFSISDKAHVLVLDDQKSNLQLLSELLSPYYHVHPFIEAEALFRYLISGKPADVILLDIVMPEQDGYEVCKLLTKIPEASELPIIFLTALDSHDDEEKGLMYGAADYIAKPFSPNIVLARVRNQANLSRAMRIVQEQNKYLDQRVAERTADLARKNIELLARNEEVTRTQDATVLALCTLSELRDNDTGKHISRTQRYVRELAMALRVLPQFSPVLDDEMILQLFKSAPLHDIGKVAIPDRILLKPGKLDRDEFEIMKTHAALGNHAIRRAEVALGSTNSFLSTARDIAHCHHEKWDGSGYPCGLSGEDIPLSARIMAVADVYDALTCKRVYKPSMSHEMATDIIREGRGTHFDPVIVDGFLGILDVFEQIARELSDAD